MNQLGIGNQILWGLGVSGKISAEHGFYIATELIGSFDVGTALASQSPLFWDIGIRRSKANATYFSAAYGIGLNSASPRHTVLVGIGWIWETVPPAKKKDPPTVKVDISLSGLPAGANVSVGSKDRIKTETVGVGPPPKGGPGGPGGPGAAGAPDGTGAPGAPGAAPGGAGGPGGKSGGGKGGGGGGDGKPPKADVYKTSTEVTVPDGLVPDDASKGGGGGGGGGGKGGGKGGKE